MGGRGRLAPPCSRVAGEAEGPVGGRALSVCEGCGAREAGAGFGRRRGGGGERAAPRRVTSRGGGAASRARGGAGGGSRREGARRAAVT